MNAPLKPENRLKSIPDAARLDELERDGLM